MRQKLHRSYVFYLLKPHHILLIWSTYMNLTFPIRSVPLKTSQKVQTLNLQKRLKFPPSGPTLWPCDGCEFQIFSPSFFIGQEGGKGSLLRPCNQWCHDLWFLKKVCAKFCTEAMYFLVDLGHQLNLQSLFDFARSLTSLTHFVILKNHELVWFVKAIDCTLKSEVHKQKIHIRI